MTIFERGLYFSFCSVFWDGGLKGASMAGSRRSNPHYNKMDKRLPLLIGLAAVLLLLILIFPKSPVTVAVNASDENATHSAATGLRISEVMSSNKSALPDENGAFGDWVEIWNSTDRPISLKNVGLSEHNDKILFLFPDMTLEADERIIVFCDKTNSAVAGKTLHAKFKLSSYGCAVYLFDSSGIAVDQVTVPTLNADESYALQADGTYQVTEDYSPGYENTFGGHVEYLSNYVVAANTLMINEVMAAPRSGLTDEDGDLSDWIELYNAGTETIRLDNLALSDDEQKPLKWFFPEGTVIAPGQYYIVFCSKKDKLEANTGIPHTNFSIKAQGETIVLTTKAGELVDRVTVPTMQKDMSYGRDPDTGEWKVYTLATPQKPNNDAGAAAADAYLRQKNYTGVYITEVMASASQIAPASGEEACDWVEIYNSSDQTVDLSLFGLSDNINWPHKWQFPVGTTIRAGEYKVIRLDKSATSGTDGNSLHASFAVKRAGGEIVTLSDASGHVLDRLYLPPMRTDITYGRTLGKDGFFYYDAPTPGQANGIGFAGFVQEPSFSVAGGMYKGSVTVEITVPEGCEVRYTVDGSIPTINNSTVYTGPLLINTTGVIRARAFKSGLQPSETITASYIMNTYFTLPVVSVVCDPDELWNEETGMFVSGPNVDKSKRPYKNTIYRQYGKIARPGYVEIFDLNGESETDISQGVKFALSGDYSLDLPQKSMKFRAQAQYGEKYFETALFEDRPFTYYKSFVLRNSGNDGVWTRMADGFQSQLIDKLDTNIIHQAWRPVIVYINGQYYGHYNLRERKDRYMIAQWEGLDLDEADQITILRASGSVQQGSNKEWKEMIKTIKTLSPGKNEADLQYILDRVDVDSYYDYLAIEMFFGNSDIGNTMFYKLPGEGQKWKWLIFDLDYGMFKSSFDSPKSYTKAKGMGDKLIDNTIFLKLLENDEMKRKFLERLAYVYNTLTREVMQEQLTEMYNMLEPEMRMHFEFWAPQTDKELNSDSSTTVDGSLRYWNTRVNRMRDTINRRHYYLWGFIKDAFKLSNQEMTELFGERPAEPQ